MPEADGEAQQEESPVLPAAQPSKDASLSKHRPDELHKLLAWFLRLVLFYFAELQDVFLAVPVIRRVVAFSLTPNCSTAVLRHLNPPDENK